MSIREEYTIINIREYLSLGTDEDAGEPETMKKSL